MLYNVEDSAEKIVGCVGLNGNELKGMFVDPELQGKGLGKRMTRFVEVYVKKAGFVKYTPVQAQLFPVCIHLQKHHKIPRVLFAALKLVPHRCRDSLLQYLL